MRIFSMVFWGLSAVLALSAHDIITTKLTYTRDISRIFARRCQNCHSSQSPIPLLTYELARPWAVSIKEQVLSRQMPPWGAVKGFGNLSPDNGLSQEEIMIISAWVVGGAPQGDPSFLPSNLSKQSPQELKLPSQSSTRDALVVSNRSTIQKPLILAGIRPMNTNPVGSARITATFPDGHIEPLLWLFRYDPQWQQIFGFREPMLLPPGSIVEADSPLRFALETSR